MAYTAPTVAEFRARFPGKFDEPGVADATIQGALNRAARQVDETWTEGDFAEARMQYAAHDLTLDGAGSSTEAELNAEGLGEFQSVKMGSLSLTRFSKTASTGDAFTDDLNSTSYGRRFLRMLRLNIGGGPLVASGDDAPLSHLGRDWPL